MKVRINSYDAMRAIAIFGVIFIHSSNAAFNAEKFSLNYNLTIIIRQIVNFSVPLFLFISGYFMSGKIINTKAEYTNYISKQVPRVLVPFIVWSSIYSAFAFIKHTDLKTILIDFITFQAAVPFYFIILIIQYYLFQPLILKLATKKNLVALSLVISLSCTFIIEILRTKYDIEVPIIIHAGNFLTWLIFPVLGAYVNTHQLKIKSQLLLLGSLFFLSISILHTFYSIQYFDKPFDAVSAVKVSSFVYSIFMCLYLFNIKEKLNLSHNNIINKIGLLSFGIYFSHMLALNVIRLITGKYLPVTVTSNVCFLLSLSALVLIICYVSGRILQKLSANMARTYFGY